MGKFTDFSLKASNYKCFGAEPQGFEAIYPINLVIGKNNSGKSALLDLVYAGIKSTGLMGAPGKIQRPEIFLDGRITEENVGIVFSKTTSGGGVPGENFYEYGIQWIGKKLTFKIEENGRQTFVALDPIMDLPQARGWEA